MQTRRGKARGVKKCSRRMEVCLTPEPARPALGPALTSISGPVSFADSHSLDSRFAQRDCNAFSLLREAEEACCRPPRAPKPRVSGARVREGWRGEVCDVERYVDVAYVTVLRVREGPLEGGRI